MTNTYAFQLTENDNQIQAEVTQYSVPTLNENEVKIAVSYSSLNYKDALATQANGGVIRHYPMVPGIDLVGTIIETTDSKWTVGQKVVVTGFDLGVKHPGGLSTVQVVPSNWLVALPESLSEKQAMIYGTAGFTAALAVQAITNKLENKDAAIAITGASGGVASIAIALLHDLGYTELTAISRKKEDAAWLKSLGTKTVVSPDEILPEKARPLDKQVFDGVIDTVGGELMSRLLPLISYDGIAALCGNAGGIKINTTVLPFILRAVHIAGIDSVAVPISKRPAIWQLLADHQTAISAIPVTEIPLVDVPKQVEKLLAGTHQGRTIVHLGE